MNHMIVPTHATQGSTAKQVQAAEQAFPAQQPQFSHAVVARRAYEIYILGGCQIGQCEENWRQAELALRTEARASSGGIECGCEEAPAPFDGSIPIVKSDPQRPHFTKSAKA